MGRLAVALIWHMHQPYYCDDVNRRVLLPWVRRRASKDYLHMLEVARQFPGLRITMNFVPSLLRQLRLADDLDYLDIHRDLALRKAEELTPAEGEFLRTFALVADAHQRVTKHQAYSRLRDELRRQEALTTDQIRDLQAWSMAAWFTPEDVDRSRLLGSIVDKGRGFSENDKLNLDKQQQLRVREVIPHLQQAIAEGVVEPMTSPYHHPILPLLIDSDVAKRPSPQGALPRTRFVHPEDAEEQLRRGLAYFAQESGVRPEAIWSPECAISPESLRLLGSIGDFWTVSDQRVLVKTRFGGHDGELSLSEKFRPYRFGDAATIVFRDTLISNRIGFDYPRMDCDAAIDDLRRTLLAIAREQPGNERWLVPIALDGENCWDFYPENGGAFLSGLYELLTGEPELESVHVGDFLRRFPDSVRSLDDVWSGSWIDADFSTWIGSDDQNRAWTLLEQSRNQVLTAGDPVASREEILVAEASDWFWWFGPHHDSGIDSAWDELFRSHLLQATTLAGAVPAEELNNPVLRSSPLHHDVAPLREISPVSPEDEEWRACGRIRVGEMFGTMHPAFTSITEVDYGRDAQALYLRFANAGPGKRVEVCFPSGRALLDNRDASSMARVRFIAPSDSQFHLVIHEGDRSEQRVPSRGEVAVAGRTGRPGKRIALVAAECAPLVTYGDLAFAVEATAVRLAESGHQAMLIIPAHRSLPLAGFAVRESRMRVRFQEREVLVDLLQGRLGSREQPVLAIDSPQYFNRDEIYGAVDDAERYLFFSAAAARVLQTTAFAPDVIVAYDWEAALAAVMALPAAPGVKRVLVRSGAEFTVSREQLLGAGVTMSEIPFDSNEIASWAAYRCDTSLVSPSVQEIAATAASV